MKKKRVNSMERYTNKYDIVVAVDKDGTEHHSKGIAVTDITLAKEKLYQLEDLMEKYSIPDVEYLEKCIQDHDKYGETSEKLDIDLAKFVNELIYVLKHSNQTTGYTSKGKEIITDYGYVESFIEDLKTAIKDNGE